jgi:hypothetical protein
VYSTQIETKNAPTVLTAPYISGQAQVGASMTASAGTFQARAGAGALSSVSGQWLRCSDAAAAHCSPIAGSTRTTYAPAAEDVGYYLVYQNTVSDGDGATTSDSQPTVAVTVANSGSGSNGGTGGTGGTGGNGGDTGTGGSAGSGGSGTGGTGTGGAGTPVTVDVLPSGSNLGSVLLGSAASWSITLRVSPRHVRRHTKVKLSGLVSTAPRPSQGKLIYLQARSVGVVNKGSGHRRHRVNVYGKWTSFQIFRAKTDGSFSSTYTFRLGGKHRYQFRAVAPAEGQYRNPTGSSAISTVEER